MLMSKKYKFAVLLNGVNITSISNYFDLISIPTCIVYIHNTLVDGIQGYFMIMYAIIQVLSSTI